MNKRLTIIKIGGRVVNDSEKLAAVLSFLKESNLPVLLVHGGGDQLDNYLSRVGIEPVKVDGRRITDAATMEMAVMTYAGLINKTIVAHLHAKGAEAVGLTGADLGIIQAVKRKSTPIDYGLVGDIVQVKGQTVKKLLDLGVIPVFCAVSVDQSGILLNTNADTIAAKLAESLSQFFEVHLVYLFDQKGICYDIMKPEHVRKTITRAGFKLAKKNGELSGGILPKLDNAFDSIEKGVQAVVMCDENGLSTYGSKNFTGTTIINE